MIRRHFSVAYHVEHVRKILRHRQLWTSQKPQAKAKQRNTEAIDHGRTQELPVILKRAQDRKAHLVFLDESGFQTSPLVRRTYAPRGQTPIVVVQFADGQVVAA